MILGFHAKLTKSMKGTKEEKIIKSALAPGDTEKHLPQTLTFPFVSFVNFVNFA